MNDTGAPNHGSQETATLGGGCFWCTEAVFLEVEGVGHVESGYAGGKVPHPSYEAVCDGRTGHAEVVRVTFDPAVISYAEVLEIFMGTHDPTTLNRQGNDVGTQYRSAIFTESDEQARVAHQTIADLNAQHVFDLPIVTEITPLAGNYYPAEAYHQNYFAQHPNQGYCAYVVAPKVAKLRQKFSHRLRRAGSAI